MAIGSILVAGCTNSRDGGSATTLVGTASSTTVAGSSLGTAAGAGATTLLPPATSADPTLISADPGSTSPATTPVTGAPPTTSPDTTTTVAPTTTEAPTTSTIPALVTEGAIIKVANSTNFGGGAGILTDALNKAGFHTTDPTNGAGQEEFLDTSHIYALPGAEAVALSLGAALGISVARMPTPAPINDATAGLGDATVLVMLGRDLVGKTPAGLKPYIGG
ncbi:MAG: LytR family transcriptional regulator [Ilumatobacteraceae bacterium]|nr:LytR family transcriptional regulator [Ilumatobacteraceae bacterium]